MATTDACMERPNSEFRLCPPLSFSNMGTQVKGKQTPGASDDGNDVNSNNRDVNDLDHDDMGDADSAGSYRAPLLW